METNQLSVGNMPLGYELQSVYILNPDDVEMFGRQLMAYVKVTLSEVKQLSLPPEPKITDADLLKVISKFFDERMKDDLRFYMKGYLMQKYQGHINPQTIIDLVAEKIK